MKFPASKDVLEAVKNAGGPTPSPAGKGICSLTPKDAVDFFVAVRRLNYRLREEQKASNKPPKGFTSSSGNSWVDPMMESYLRSADRVAAGDPD